MLPTLRDPGACSASAQQAQDSFGNHPVAQAGGMRSPAYRQGAPAPHAQQPWAPAPFHVRAPLSLHIAPLNTRYTTISCPICCLCEQDLVSENFKLCGLCGQVYKESEARHSMSVDVHAYSLEERLL